MNSGHIKKGCMRSFFVTAIATGFLTLSGPADAACTDAPAPGVNWQSCFQDGRPFNGVNLNGANLRDANFSRSDFSAATLTGIDGRRAKFFSAVMKEADFSDANLTQADFTGADLTDASFRNANLQRTLLYRATLRGVDFTGANLSGTDFMFSDLSGAIWTDGERVCAEGSRSRCQ